MRSSDSFWLGHWKVNIADRMEDYLTAKVQLCEFEIQTLFVYTKIEWLDG